MEKKSCQGHDEAPFITLRINRGASGGHHALLYIYQGQIRINAGHTGICGSFVTITNFCICDSERSQRSSQRASKRASQAALLM